MYYEDTNSLLLKVTTGNLLVDLESDMLISSRMDYTNWDEAIYLELMEC